MRGTRVRAHGVLQLLLVIISTQSNKNYILTISHLWLRPLLKEASYFYGEGWGINWLTFPSQKKETPLFLQLARSFGTKIEPL